MKRLCFMIICLVLMTACAPSPEKIATRTAAAGTAIAASWTKTSSPPTSTPTKTATSASTLTPTITPTATLTPIPTREILCPAGLSSLENITGTMVIPGIQLAPLLPLPGEFKVIVYKKTNEKTLEGKGIVLKSGPDHTAEIVRREATGEPKDADILVLFNLDSTSFGTYGTKAGVSVFMRFVNEQDLWNSSLFLDYAGGLVQMVQQDGRRLFLKGILEFPVIDESSEEVLYWLHYDFGENASIVWDRKARTYNWCNIEVEIIK